MRYARRSTYTSLPIIPLYHFNIFDYAVLQVSEVFAYVLLLLLFFAYALLLMLFCAYALLCLCSFVLMLFCAYALLLMFFLCLCYFAYALLRPAYAFRGLKP